MNNANVIVIGAGLSGYFASYLARGAGLKVINVSQGRGGWILYHGCLDIWSRNSPTKALNKLVPSHPYAIAGADSLRAGIETFLRLMERSGYSYSGDLSKNFSLPLAGGGIHTTSFAPAAAHEGDLRSDTQFTVVAIPELDDFSPEYLYSVSARSGIPCEGVLELPLPGQLQHCCQNSLDLARTFDQPHKLASILEAWKGRQVKTARLAFPAVLGFERHPQVFHSVQQAFGVPVFEIPTLPPSVAGLRIERLFRIEFLRSRVELVEGRRAIGLIDGRSHGRLVAGVQVEQSGHPATLEADAVILASGSFLNGGLIAFHDGRVQESVFDLPLSADPDRENWTGHCFRSTQPYAGFGVLVDGSMRPRGADGNPIFENLFACGGIIAGADREIEGSRQGIDLATAYRAAQAASEWIRDRG